MMTTENTGQNGHYRDGIGVCIYCDKCADDGCCPEGIGPCSRSVLKQMDETAEKMLHIFRQQGRV